MNGAFLNASEPNDGFRSLRLDASERNHVLTDRLHHNRTTRACESASSLPLQLCDCATHVLALKVLIFTL